MSKFVKVAFAVAAAVSLTATSAQAQSGNISATATVLQALSVTGAATLDFGTGVLPGINATVDASTDATAGRFDLSGVASQGVNLSFVLPTDLNSGGNLLPIASWTGCLSPTATQIGCSGFTPSAGNTATALSGSGALSVYVGATVSPGGLQPAGSYSGIITLNASYY